MYFWRKDLIHNPSLMSKLSFFLLSQSVLKFLEVGPDLYYMHLIRCRNVDFMNSIHTN